MERRPASEVAAAGCSARLRLGAREEVLAMAINAFSDKDCLRELDLVWRVRLGGFWDDRANVPLVSKLSASIRGRMVSVRRAEPELGGAVVGCTGERNSGACGWAISCPGEDEARTVVVPARDVAADPAATGSDPCWAVVDADVGGGIEAIITHQKIKIEKRKWHSGSPRADLV